MSLRRKPFCSTFIPENLPAPWKSAGRRLKSFSRGNQLRETPGATNPFRCFIFGKQLLLADRMKIKPNFRSLRRKLSVVPPAGSEKKVVKPWTGIPPPDGCVLTEPGHTRTRSRYVQRRWCTDFFFRSAGRLKKTLLSV